MMGETDAELVLEEASDTLRCITCGTDYAGTKLDLCPECRGDGLVIDRAPEFAVRSWMGSP
jgi:Zn finger protein HypA/HybF involved in hydrogenase expression